MFDIIVACTSQYGIGIDNKMPWNCSEELKLFREKTHDSVLIMGRKTVQNLPFLKNRHIICVTRNHDLDTTLFKNSGTVCPNISTALQIAKEQFPGKHVFIAGGAKIYNQCFLYFKDDIVRVHISYMKKNYECDRVFKPNFTDMVIESETDYDDFVHMVLKTSKNGEKQYLDLINKVSTLGKMRSGRNGDTKSLFTEHLSFDLTQGFPLLTTKKMFTRGIIEELLFFLRGETDTKVLEDKKVNIWKGNTSREFLDGLGMTERKEGMMGQMYGYQWRYFNAEYSEYTGQPKYVNHDGVDQLKLVTELIKTDPMSRRILLTTFNPSQASQGVLYPCHSIIIQYYVDGEYLDMFCYNRSQDLFLGTPFNIASSALLLSIIAKLCNLTPRSLNITLGDAHIYKSHLDAIPIQTSRQPYKFPTLEIRKDLSNLTDIEKLRVEDFVITGYKHHPAIKREMVV